MSLIFEDLPASPADRIDWQHVGATLRERPNEWARIGSYPSRSSAATIAYQINHGKKHARLFAYGRFEAKSRTVDGECRVYVRYVGPGSTGGAE